MTKRALILAGLLASAAAARSVVLNAKPMAAPQRTIAGFPLSLGEWRSAGDVPFTGTIESVLGVDEYVNRVYRNAQGDELGLYVGYYRMQRQGAAIHSPLNCLPGAGWQPVSSERVSLGDAAGPLVNRVVVQKGEAQQLVYYWYQSSGRVIASEYWSKFYLVSDSIVRRRSDAALVRIVEPVTRIDTGHEPSAGQDRIFVALVASTVRSTIFQ
jgi:EpsI family protein